MAASKDSILGSVRKALGSDEYFDQDLILHINTVFSKLQQMGVGPEGGFSIDDDTSEWDKFTEDERVLNMVKSYMILQVRLLFDISTASSSLVETMKQQSSELEWRLNSACDYGTK
jgi:hypothetical protein